MLKVALLVAVLSSDSGIEAGKPSLEVKGFIRAAGIQCHCPKKQKDDKRLDTLSPSLGDPAEAQLWQNVLDIINLGDMPPETADQPDEAAA